MAEGGGRTRAGIWDAELLASGSTVGAADAADAVSAPPERMKAEEARGAALANSAAAADASLIELAGITGGAAGFPGILSGGERAQCARASAQRISRIRNKRSDPQTRQGHPRLET